MWQKIKSLVAKGIKTPRKLDELKMLLGQIRFEQIMADPAKPLANLQAAEFQVFSQWGDDGIIQFLVRHLSPEDKRFVEFGVENYEESNTRYLLANNNWKGLVIDGSAANIAHLKADNLYWRHDLTALASFVTAENINGILEETGFTGKIGLFHIDIDGNDYWVWNALTVVDPDIMVMEYNASFGPAALWTVPYDPGFTRRGAHFSDLYFGASLGALCHLAAKRGYQFVGCNSNGVNAYFVKSSLAADLPKLTCADGYMPSRFRESRDASGNLTFLSMADRRALLSGLPVVNVETGKTEAIRFPD